MAKKQSKAEPKTNSKIEAIERHIELSEKSLESGKLIGIHKDQMVGIVNNLKEDLKKAKEEINEG